jgi:putative membrane protein
MLAGAAAGVVGTLAMDAFQRIFARAAGRDKHHGAQTLRTGGPLRSRSEQVHGGVDDPTEKVAAIAVESLSGGTLTREERDRVGTLVHYAFGTVTGALYGLVADRWPGANSGAGAAFGLTVWVGAELVATPALGLSRQEHEYPAWIPLYGAAAHVVYGVSTELVRRRF